MNTRVAVVTGGARGMGHSHVLGLAGAGYSVVVLDTQSASDSALEQAGVSCMIADVGEEDAVKATFSAILARHGRIDVLVNNAGGALSGAACEDHSLDEWERTLRLNLTGPFLCIRAALPAMKLQRSGRIINVATASVFSGITGALYRDGANLVPYVAAKGGLVGLTTSLARELGQWNITVNAIAPGFTPTPRVRESFPQAAMERMVEDQALRRMLEPNDATGAILFLASDGAAMMTGQVLRIDGGSAMG